MTKAELQAELEAARLRIIELENEEKNDPARTGAFERGHQQGEKELLQINRLYSTLSHINQTVIHAHRREDLFQDVCHVAVQYGEFKLAWIGLLDPVSGNFKPAFSSTGRLDDLPFSSGEIKSSLLENSLIGKALAGSKSFTSEDIQTDSLAEPLAGNRRPLRLPFAGRRPIPTKRPYHRCLEPVFRRGRLLQVEGRSSPVG